MRALLKCMPGTRTAFGHRYTNVGIFPLGLRFLIFVERPVHLPSPHTHTYSESGSARSHGHRAAVYSNYQGPPRQRSARKVRRRREFARLPPSGAPREAYPRKTNGRRGRTFSINNTRAAAETLTIARRPVSSPCASLPVSLRFFYARPRTVDHRGKYDHVVGLARITDDFVYYRYYRRPFYVFRPSDYIVVLLYQPRSYFDVCVHTFYMFAFMSRPTRKYDESVQTETRRTNLPVFLSFVGHLSGTKFNRRR